MKAMMNLDEMNIDYELNVVGGYNPYDVLMNKYKPKHVNFIGQVPQDELKSFLASSDCYLFPSLCEGCAQSGMEALTAGLPVIATYESGLPISDGQTGLLIETANVKSIVDAVMKLHKDKELREKLGRNAAGMMKQNYTWDIYAENIVNVYNSLI